MRMPGKEWTVQQGAVALGISATHFLRLVDAKKIPSHECEKSPPPGYAGRPPRRFVWDEDVLAYKRELKQVLRGRCEERVSDGHKHRLVVRMTPARLSKEKGVGIHPATIRKWLRDPGECLLLQANEEWDVAWKDVAVVSKGRVRIVPQPLINVSQFREVLNRRATLLTETYESPEGLCVTWRWIRKKYGLSKSGWRWLWVNRSTTVLGDEKKPFSMLARLLRTTRGGLLHYRDTPVYLLEHVELIIANDGRRKGALNGRWAPNGKGRSRRPEFDGSSTVPRDSSRIFFSDIVPAKYREFARRVAAEKRPDKTAIAADLFGQNSASARRQFNRYLKNRHIVLPKK